MKHADISESFFESCINCYLDELEDRTIEKTLTKEEKDRIIKGLIYNDDILYEHIFNRIKYNIAWIIESRDSNEINDIR